MFILKNTMIGLAVFLALAGCGNKGSNIKDYYFPVAALSKGAVYVFASENGDSTDQEYWYYQSIKTDSGTFLVSTYYDRQFEIGQIVREKVVKSGVLAREYTLFVPDTVSGKVVGIPTVLLAGNTFPFVVHDSLGIFLFNLKYHPAEDSATTISVVRNRCYLGEGPPFTWSGKSVPLIRFRLRERYGNEQEGTAEVEGVGEEGYARGIGLVYYRKSIGEGKYHLAYRLKEIISMDELIRRAGKKLLPGGGGKSPD